MRKFYALDSCYLIAEIGVNHNGDMKLAKNMIDAAKSSGADAVKFQTFKAESLVTHGTPKVAYQESTTQNQETHFEMLKKLELSEIQHKILKKYCDQNNIDFISTPYDPKSVDFLEKLNVRQYKIASADIVDHVLLRRVALTGKPVMISVGMATLEEIEDALRIFSKYDADDIILLHCVSNYPCSFEALNLKVIKTLQSTFRHPVGYSDHSIGSQASSLSIALGAKVIEKHFTLDKLLPGPDHKASSSPKEFMELKQAIDQAELILGSEFKECQPEEKQMSQISRKSIVLSKNMKKGEEIKRSDLIMMRPGYGLRAKIIEDLIGKILLKNLKKHSLLNLDDLK